MLAPPRFSDDLVAASSQWDVWLLYVCVAAASTVLLGGSAVKLGPLRRRFANRELVIKAFSRRFTAGVPAARD